MREIKFRVWDPNNDYMHQDISAMRINLFDYSGDNITEQSGLHIMQYTGLKDKNDKGIYEGDIVESSHPIYDGEKTNKNVVKFIDFCWRLEAINSGMTANAPIGLYARLPEAIVIIGNIYENPELLEVIP